MFQAAEDGRDVLGATGQQGELQGRVVAEGGAGGHEPAVGFGDALEVGFGSFGDAGEVVELGAVVAAEGFALAAVAVVRALAEADEVEGVGEGEAEVAGEAFERGGLEALAGGVAEFEEGGGLEAEQGRAGGASSCFFLFFFFFFFFKQKTAYAIRLSLVGSDMRIRDSRGWAQAMPILPASF
ncbi:hypothetical protein DEGR_37590 (plasmid) [Deinococcus grandis]|nr:hypothetical protein DEGR_37590 [Deinococcus grandis]